jgi:DNA-binding GntR family transcriptional regulator
MRTSGGVGAYHTKAELALTLLKESIKRGEFRPGDPLPQRILARRFGMSLTPVREAVRALEAGGMLSGSSHRTLRVLDVTAEDVREIYMVRSALEDFATAVAVPHLTAADVNRLDESIQKMAAACQRRQPRRYQTLDEEFHMFLYRSAGNKLLFSLIEALWSRYPRDVLRTVPGRLRASQDEHRRLMRAVREGSGARAGALMRAHILSAMNAVLRFLGHGAGRPAADWGRKLAFEHLHASVREGPGGAAGEAGLKRERAGKNN